MTRFKIGQKLLMLLLAVSLGPLVAVSIILVINAQTKLRSEATTQQRLAATSAADRVDSFLAERTNILIFQSQTSAARQFDIPNASLNLAALVKQDRDVVRVSLVDKTGLERIVLDQNGLIAKHSNVSSSDAFKSTTFLAGKEYIGPVVYVDGKPHVTIAVPLIRFTAQQDLTHLSTAELGKYRSPDDIQGVLITEFNLGDLWQSVLSTKIGANGYAYLVDDKGALIAHPDASFQAAHHDLSAVHEVKDFLTSTHDVRTSISEKGVPVLGTYKATTRANWGVIVEEPTSSVFASVNAFYRLGLGILVVVAAVVVICSLLFRRQLLVPIQLMAAGALRIGRGDFRYKIPIKSDDELGNLAHSFNSMGGSLEAFVHDLQRRNQSLNVERRKQASILQSISDGIIAVNKNQEVVLINEPAAALIGKKPEDLTGKSMPDNFAIMHNEQAFRLNLAKPGVYHYDDLILPHGEKSSYLELVVVVAEAMSDIAAIITVHDLTQGRELEVMKLDFVAIAAHELRTPLTVVRGYLDLVNSSEEVSRLTVMNIEYLQRAQSGITQLGNLINNILNVSRIERGSMRVKLSKVDIVLLIHHIIEEQKVSVVLRQQHITYEGPTNKVFVAADESAIAEVIDNLLSNAIKYTSENGHIAIKLSQTGEFVRVEVIDDGRGIPESSKEHLFTKFYRVENSLTTGNRGTGLGLYISKSIITLHHGEIGVVSKLGEGSTFFFTLPLFQEGKHPNTSAEAKELDSIHGWFPKRPNS
ncbi:MAG TPA: ATP-binding protein [Patescibacteria group bacterium]|nr:ATP-binding protein [Patescibacteria group bacterium]